MYNVARLLDDLRWVAQHYIHFETKWPVAGYGSRYAVPVGSKYKERKIQTLTYAASVESLKSEPHHTEAIRHRFAAWNRMGSGS